MNTIDVNPSLFRTENLGYITELKEKTKYQQAINTAWRRAEPDCVEDLIEHTEIDAELNQKIYALAFDLAHSLRERKSSGGKAGIVQGLLQEFALSSQEGIALMCLAEALLRIPDNATRDLLIRDKINQGNWKEHLGQSQLMFVNAAAWGLMLTGKLMETPKQNSLSGMLTGLLARSGRGIIRKAVDVAMRMMGEQFVTGETIDEALQHAEVLEQQGFRYSYDMLGEAALTEADAERYLNDYTQAIHAIGQASQDKDVYDGPGISIKLSALHPRYQRSQIERVHQELYPRILELARLAKSYNIGLNIDAEETERLEISLELLERLCFEPELCDWLGIGFVIQAYQKRCFYVVDYLIDLAQRSQKRLMIRLVKGAYWDSEIKKAQVDGMSDYPVFTRKVHTDLSYIACAKKLLAAPEWIYPQFATHNAQTVATIYQLANPTQYYSGQYEFQCLHGMGEPLYEQVVGDKQQHKLGVPCRIYAPVGNHETLLAYLVRRLLENGANTSFVNRIADKTLKIEHLITDPIAEIQHNTRQQGKLGTQHSAIAAPKALLQPIRENSTGLDLADDSVLSELDQRVSQFITQQWHAQPMLFEHAQPNASTNSMQQEAQPNIEVINPANHFDLVGTVQECHPEQVEHALHHAEQAQALWQNVSCRDRADMLNRAADLMQDRMQMLMVLLCRENGKTYANGIAEVREAVDFLRYYAAQMISLETQFQSPSSAKPAALTPLGTVLCISPWNFPLAIFTGQIAAALATGNCVIAKPAEQTPLIASQAIAILWEAGIPPAVLQLTPGRGETVGAQLSNDARVDAVMFTGSTEVAKILQHSVSQRLNRHAEPVVLIAETGGQNAMIVDSSALTEQVVIDAVSSAFDSAGQRCSALRVLCVQQDHADRLIAMLKGAMQQLQLGNPLALACDVGPVIDAEAQHSIQQHIDRMRDKGYPIHQLSLNHSQTETMFDPQHGSFIAPTLIELPHLNDLTREVFGPVLHVIRYAYGELDALLDQINQKGYGLTMGLHTRIDATIQTVVEQAHVGNLYINRNIVGAVVGVQPFGGEGLSGTGPKAGGPLYLYKLLHKHASNLPQPFGTLEYLAPPTNPAMQQSYQDFLDWAHRQFPSVALNDLHSPIGSYRLPGPTGEANSYQIHARETVLCLAENTPQWLAQLQLALRLGCKVLVPTKQAWIEQYYATLPTAVKQHIQGIDLANLPQLALDVVMHHGDTASLKQIQALIAQRQGAIVSIQHYAENCLDLAMDPLLFERALSINTAAAGGNASLMTLSN